ncbi:MAG: helix-turn-helix domain-containing protein [Gammaproteobacteria bacterium]
MLLTIALAAEQLRVHPRTLRRAIDRGELAVIRCGTSRKSDRIHPEDLEKYIDRQRRFAQEVKCPSVNVVTLGRYRSLSPDVALESLLAKRRVSRRKSLKPSTSRKSECP